MTGWWITLENDYAITQRLPVGAFIGVTVLTVTKTTDILHRDGFEVRP